MFSCVEDSMPLAMVGPPNAWVHGMHIGSCSSLSFSQLLTPGWGILSYECLDLVMSIVFVFLFFWSQFHTFPNTWCATVFFHCSWGSCEADSPTLAVLYFFRSLWDMIHWNCISCFFTHWQSQVEWCHACWEYSLIGHMFCGLGLLEIEFGKLETNYVHRCWVC